MWKKNLQITSIVFFVSLFFLFPTRSHADEFDVSSEEFANCFCWFYPEGGNPTDDQFCLGGAHVGMSSSCQKGCEELQDDFSSVLKQTLHTLDETQAADYEDMCYRYPAPSSEDSASVVAPTEPQNFIAPELAVTLDPDFEFSPILSEGGIIKVTYLTEYLQMLYNYLLGITSVVAIVMIMFYGGMYIFSAGSSALAQKAVGGIKKTLWGFGLLFVCVALLELVNPELTLFRALEIQSIDELELDTYLEGTDAPTGTSHASSLASMKEPCQAIYQEALAEGICSMSNNQKFYSPTGTGPNCGNHHWFDGGASGEWKNIKNLDWAAPWGSAIRAPFAGTVSYKKQEDTSNRCGNRIYLEGNNARITICHAKDFLDESGAYQGQRTVQAGATIGHVGGECCSSSTAPSNYTGTTCDVAGTACTDPTSNTACQCQTPEQSGNTTGGHAHVTWQGEGNFLPCLIDGAP